MVQVQGAVLTVAQGLHVATGVATIPLLLAKGPGAASRFSMGVVIASGMTIGTLLTLYVVPVMYQLVASDLGGQKDIPVNTTPAPAHA